MLTSTIGSINHSGISISNLKQALLNKTLLHNTSNNFIKNKIITSSINIPKQKLYYSTKFSVDLNDKDTSKSFNLYYYFLYKFII